MRDGSRTRARIEQEALRLFAERGIHATSMRDIAAAVGVAEGALYRHFPAKEALSRALFLDGYAALARRLGEVEAAAPSFPALVHGVVEAFCALFDEDRARFAFLLLEQHAHLHEVEPSPDTNVVEAVSRLFAGAIARHEVRGDDPDLMAALALGIVSQPAVFTLYGRLKGPMLPRAQALAAAVLAAAGAAARSPAGQG